MDSFTYRTATIDVRMGDITAFPTQALVTLINSGRLWFGGVDSAIMRVAGNQFHRVPAQCSLSDGDVVIAEGPSYHRGAFHDVIFVVDDLKRPLGELVAKALDAAYATAYTTVSFPAMRTGVMLGAYEPTAVEAVQQTVQGLARSIERHTQSIALTVVVYSDNAVAELFVEQLHTLTAE